MPDLSDDFTTQDGYPYKGQKHTYLTVPFPPSAIEMIDKFATEWECSQEEAVSALAARGASWHLERAIERYLGGQK